MKPDQIDRVARDAIEAAKTPGEKNDQILRLIAESVFAAEIKERVREISSQEKQG